MKAPTPFVGYALVDAEGNIDHTMIATKAKLVRRWVDDIYGAPWKRFYKLGFRVVKITVSHYEA